MRQQPPQDPKETEPLAREPGYPDPDELEAIRRALRQQRRPARRSARRWLPGLGAALAVGGAILGLRGEEKPLMSFEERWSKPVTIPSGFCGVQASRPWLVRHQSADGRWDADGFTERCEDKGCVASVLDRGGAGRDVGVTGAALLLAISDGHKQRLGVFKSSVKRALDWLSSRQGPDGVFRGSGQPDAWSAADQAIATFALCRLYAAAPEPDLKSRAERALEGLHALAAPGRIARPLIDDSGDGAVPGAWASLAFRAADRAGLARPKEALRRAEACIHAPPRSSGGGGPDYLDSALSADQAPLAAAAACLARRIQGALPFDADMRRACDRLVEASPKLGETPPEYWLFVNEAFAIAPSADLRRLLEEPRRLFLKSLGRRGCAEGSMKSPSVSAYPGGRIYATALASLALAWSCRPSNGAAIETPVLILEEEVLVTKEPLRGPCLFCERSYQRSER